MTKSAKLAAVGGLSRPSKMPGHSWSISAKDCKTGGKLVNKPGSVCNKCYALKGRYAFPNVQAAQNRRHDLYKSSKTWREDMVAAIRATKDTEFRVFDAGDLQSVTMLRDWVWIAEQLPHVKFWLPTKEYGFVKAFLKLGGIVPDNMTVRISQAMIDDMTPHKLVSYAGITASAVSSKGHHTCPAPVQDDQCKDCRMCWNRDVQTVVYKQH